MERKLAAIGASGSVPAHVPGELVVAFDVYRPLQAGPGYCESFKAAQDRGLPDIFRSPHKGIRTGVNGSIARPPLVRGP